ncbi:MAG TPA: class I SAM-dependent methyltransferase [Caulobacteraceae bacterium]|jgi:2-polyprenyl-3-methyl-5-hydroxy-6-metoxy-1,4-benzoquinol methylase|nr:class I SAM-dependent methyltransferase [Caulobacteraceae bacterium]
MGWLRPYPACGQVVAAVLAAWPDHVDYLARNFEIRSPAIMAASELAAKAALRLMSPNIRRFAANYRWTCERLREEELHFHREGRYRLSTFQEAWEEIYSDSDYMARYVDGLLLSQILWFNHACTFEMFMNRVLAGADQDLDYLEIGPGHGLMVYLAARSSRTRRLEAWDVSEVSLAETRSALDRLRTPKAVTLRQADILSAAQPEGAFDLVVISEVLEHLERPVDAIAFLSRALAPDGRLFASVPLNSPSPDHIYLFDTPDAVSRAFEQAGMRVDSMELFATQGIPVEKALRRKVSISAGVIASNA